LNLLEEFLKTFPGILPLGGRLDRLKGGQEDDPAYDYAWNPGGLETVILSTDSPYCYSWPSA
jgi:UDP-N-acetylmuramyl tripeptide synthase